MAHSTTIDCYSYFLLYLFLVTFACQFQQLLSQNQSNFNGGKNDLRDMTPLNWRVVESLAEHHPYMAGLLNASKDFVCSGIVIDKRTVLTAGSCIRPELHYIAIGSAVLSRSLHKNNLYEIANTLLHGDYNYELRTQDPNVTQVHSNIGLVFSVKPDLEAYFPAADLGNYYATELHEKNLRVVGYVMINENKMAVLQQQLYHQSPCANPKWYYCVCGYEVIGAVRTYGDEFGEGAPVLLNSEVVGVAAAPCGVLAIKNVKVPYNIFTVLGPYLPWIDKRNTNYVLRHNFKKSKADKRRPRYICVLLVIVKGLFY